MTLPQKPRATRLADDGGCLAGELKRLRHRLLEQRRTLAGLTRRNEHLAAENTRLRRELARGGRP